MSEEPKYKVKKVIENGKIRYTRVPLSLNDELEERDNEISRLKKLVDELRKTIEGYQEEERRKKLIDEPSDTAESYRIYS